MFNNNGGNYKEINVNTGVETFWSSIASLNVGCYNDKISLRWLPASGKDERGYTRYNSEARVSTCVTHTKIHALLKRYDKKLRAMVENKEDPGEKGKSVMVPITSKGAPAGLFIEYRNDETGKPALYLTFARNLMEVGTDPSNIIRYKFNDIDMMDDMNPESGGGEQIKEFGEFEYFMDILRAHILMTGLNSHATRYSNAFSNNKKGNQNSDSDANGFSGMMPPDTDGFNVFS